MRQMPASAVLLLSMLLVAACAEADEEAFTDVGPRAQAPTPTPFRCPPRGIGDPGPNWPSELAEFDAIFIGRVIASESVYEVSESGYAYVYTTHEAVIDRSFTPSRVVAAQSLSFTQGGGVIDGRLCVGGSRLLERDIPYMIFMDDPLEDGHLVFRHAYVVDECGTLQPLHRSPPRDSISGLYLKPGDEVIKSLEETLDPGVGPNNYSVLVKGDVYVAEVEATEAEGGGPGGENEERRYTLRVTNAIFTESVDAGDSVDLRESALGDGSPKRLEGGAQYLVFEDDRKPGEVPAAIYSFDHCGRLQARAPNEGGTTVAELEGLTVDAAAAWMAQAMPASGGR